jgi:hypothetical protein
MADDYTSFYDDLLEQSKKDEELKKGKYAGFYDDLIQAQMDEKRAQEKAIPLEDDWSKLPSNIIPSLKNRGRQTAGAFLNPIDSLTAMGKLGQSGITKMGRKLAEMTSGEDIAPRGDTEDVADMFTEDLKGRYGGWPEIRNTMITDPSGVALDATGAVSPLARLPSMSMLGKIPDVAGNLGRLGQAGLRASKIPERLYANAAGIKPSNLDRLDIASGGMRARPTSKLSEQTGGGGVGVSPAGLQKADAIKKSIGNEINKIIADAAETNMPIPRTTISKYLDAMIEENRLLPDIGDVRALEKMRDDFNTQFGDKMNLFPEEMQAWKKKAYDNVYTKDASPDPLVSGGITTKAERQMAFGAKDALEKRFPDLKDVNQEFAEVARVRPFIAERLNAVDELEPSLGKMYRQTLGSPKLRGRLAILLDKIAQGDSTAWMRGLNSREIRTLIELSGRNREFVEENFAAP